MDVLKVGQKDISMDISMDILKVAGKEIATDTLKVVQ